MLEWLSRMLWGTPALVLLLGTGVYLTVRSRFFQVRCAGKIFRRTFGELFGKKSSRGQSQSVCTALAATMGTGNIVGVATALTLGGAGSVFWMWVAAFFGMMIVYAENLLSVKYRDKVCGGPMMYILRGMKSPALAAVYAAACVLASFGMGNMAQSNSLAAAVCSAVDVSPVIIGAVTAFAVGIVIIGGAKAVGGVAEKVIPIVSILYITISIILIVCDIEAASAAIRMIFSEAFGFREATGGAVGFTVSQALSAGLRRGIFSNEAGLGSASIVHADCPDAEKQGMWGTAEVFIDTMVCCTLTAVVILMVFGEEISCKGISIDGAELVTAAFASFLGRYSGIFVAVCLTLFAYATLIGWCAVGEKAWCYLTKGKYSLYYKYIYIIFILIGAVIPMRDVWMIADIFNAFMAFPNLIAIIYLSRNLYDVKAVTCENIL